jgi:Tfp pilus assembly protein PilN
MMPPVYVFTQRGELTCRQKMHEIEQLQQEIAALKQRLAKYENTTQREKIDQMSENVTGMAVVQLLTKKMTTHTRD